MNDVNIWSIIKHSAPDARGAEEQGWITNVDLKIRAVEKIHTGMLNKLTVYKYVWYYTTHTLPYLRHYKTGQEFLSISRVNK